HARRDGDGDGVAGAGRVVGPGAGDDASDRRTARAAGAGRRGRDERRRGGECDGERGVGRLRSAVVEEVDEVLDVAGTQGDVVRRVGDRADGEVDLIVDGRVLAVRIEVPGGDVVGIGLRGGDRRAERVDPGHARRDGDGDGVAGAGRIVGPGAGDDASDRRTARAAGAGRRGRDERRRGGECDGERGVGRLRSAVVEEVDEVLDVAGTQGDVVRRVGDRADREVDLVVDGGVLGVRIEVPGGDVVGIGLRGRDRRAERVHAGDAGGDGDGDGV